MTSKKISADLRRQRNATGITINTAGEYAGQQRVRGGQQANPGSSRERLPKPCRFSLDSGIIAPTASTLFSCVFSGYFSKMGACFPKKMTRSSFRNAGTTALPMESLLMFAPLASTPSEMPTLCSATRMAHVRFSGQAYLLKGCVLGVR